MKEDSAIYVFVIIVFKMASRSPNFVGKNGTHFFSLRVGQRITLKSFSASKSHGSPKSDTVAPTISFYYSNFHYVAIMFPEKTIFFKKECLVKMP